MKCARVQDLFSSYLEGTMDSPLCMAVEQHLADCPRCKSAYDRFHAAVVMLEEMPEMEPPPDFHASVMAGVQRARVTAPKPVKWWEIDWQHVFTIRVPARAAAAAVAVLLLMVITVQLTPLGPVVGGFIGLRHAQHSTVPPVDDGGVNPWVPQGTSFSAADAGLSIGIAARASGTYDLRLGTKSNEPVAFTIDTGRKAYNGVVVSDQDTVIKVSVPSTMASITAKVEWRHGNKGHDEALFLPAKFDERSSEKRLSFSMQNVTIRQVLRRISEDYGIVILASGDIDYHLPYAAVRDGNPGDALYDCLESAGMKGQALADSVYVVEPTR